jgi:hypothetical protein
MTATCVDQSADVVRQMVQAFRPERGVQGALEFIRKATIDHDQKKQGVSFWKLHKLWNTNLQKYGFTLEADEHRTLQAAWFEYLDKQEDQIRARLDQIHQLRKQRAMGGEPQNELAV